MPRLVLRISRRILCRCYSDEDGNHFHYFYRDRIALAKHTAELTKKYPSVKPRGKAYYVLGTPNLITQLIAGCGYIDANFDNNDPKPGELCG